MKRILLMFFVVGLGWSAGFSQAGMWTWMKGDSVINRTGVYGTRGVADAANKPEGRYGAANWTDHQGNLWLFGGKGLGGLYKNDLWKYDWLLHQWTWITGDSLGNRWGIYGNLGTADSANKPGGRYAAVNWLDQQGNLWLFGGYGRDGSTDTEGFISDLWKYTITTNQWTWMGGDSLAYANGVYGVKGIAAAENKPGCRYYSMNWKDNAGNLWLYGGVGYPASGSEGELDDLWKYDVTSNQWTWISGDSVADVYSVYGNRGIPAPENNPGNRDAASSWTDHAGNFWMMGGAGKTRQGGYDDRNDLWKYDVISGHWVWISGDSLTGIHSIYGTKGIADSVNKPGSIEISMSWTAPTGNLWLFGGYGYAAAGGKGYLNTLWEYDIISNQWIWRSGDTIADRNGVYGVRGMAASENNPGGRLNSSYWTDLSGNLWLFGGFGASASGVPGFLNDLWRFNMESCVHSNPVIVANADTICEGASATFSTAENAAGIQWQRSTTGTGFVNIPGADSSFFSEEPSQSNFYRVITGNGNCRDTSLAVKLVVSPTPSLPEVLVTDTLICSGDSTLICASAEYASYLWNTGTGTRCVEVKNAGAYWLTVSDAVGCSVVSDQKNISVYPVPSVSILQNGDTLSSFGAYSYQWYLNGSKISGATSAVYIASEGGSYTLEITDGNGCTAISAPVLISGIDEMVAEAVSIYPNPSSMNNVQLTMTNDLVGSNLEVYDANGRLVSKYEIQSAKSEIELQVPKGVYFIRIYSERTSIVKKYIRL